MEGGKLQPGFEKEAVPGFLSGVEADPLIGGIGAGEAQDRIRIPALGQTGQKPRRVDPIPELPRVVPAEEPVLGVLPGQVEEELALPGGGRTAALPRRQEGETEQPAKFEPRDHGGGGHRRSWWGNKEGDPPPPPPGGGRAPGTHGARG